jgi:hypothetical protein
VPDIPSAWDGAGYDAPTVEELVTFSTGKARLLDATELLGFEAFAPLADRGPARPPRRAHREFDHPGWGTAQAVRSIFC